MFVVRENEQDSSPSFGMTEVLNNNGLYSERFIYAINQQIQRENVISNERERSYVHEGADFSHAYKVYKFAGI